MNHSRLMKSMHTLQEKQRLCAEARRQLQDGVKFALICATFDLKPATLRKWLNDQTRDWMYPPVPNVGRL